MNFNMFKRICIIVSNEQKKFCKFKFKRRQMKLINNNLEIKTKFYGV